MFCFVLVFALFFLVFVEGLLSWLMSLFFLVLGLVR